MFLVLSVVACSLDYGTASVNISGAAYAWDGYGYGQWNWLTLQSQENTEYVIM